MVLQPLLATTILFAASHAHGAERGDDAVAILRVDKVICRAFETGDAATLRANLDEGFTLVDSKGVLTDRDANLAEVDKRDPYYEVFQNRNQELRLFGDAAIVTGITAVSGHSGATTFSANFRFTDTYVFSGGRWKMAASHASRLPVADPVNPATQQVGTRKK